MLPEPIWQFIGTWEGHDTITNDPDDRGGLTRWGLSQVHHPNINVLELTEAHARIVYEMSYYNKSLANELPEFMQLIHTNCAVNCGVGIAIRTLQKTIGAKADGQFGPKSRARLKVYFSGARVFTSWYLTYQALYYFNIVQRRKSQHKWLKGWVRRTIDAAWQTATNYGGTTT